MTRIAFLGLGRMGVPMAGRLLAAGHDLTVWNRTPARAAPLAAADAAVRDTPAEAVRGRDLVIYVDAPVSGSLPQAAAGELVILAGGTETDLTRCAEPLETLGRVQHIGPPGSGAALKLVVNGVLGTSPSSERLSPSPTGWAWTPAWLLTPCRRRSAAGRGRGLRRARPQHTRAAR